MINRLYTDYRTAYLLSAVADNYPTSNLPPVAEGSCALLRFLHLLPLSPSAVPFFPVSFALAASILPTTDRTLSLFIPLVVA